VGDSSLRCSISTRNRWSSILVINKTSHCFCSAISNLAAIALPFVWTAKGQSRSV
jgi:hypothetical protein